MPKQKATTDTTRGSTTGCGHGYARSSSCSRGRGKGGRGASGSVICVDQRDWSELPLDVLYFFSRKLPDISDFIRFRAVCKNWRLSAPITHPPPQLPWLLERRQEPENDPENAVMRFYCLSTGKVHSISCQNSRRAHIRGPAYRYLLAIHTRRMFRMCVFNPLNDNAICIPTAKVFNFSHYIGLDTTVGGDIVIVSGHADHARFPDMEWNTAPPMTAFLRPDVDQDWVYVAGVGTGANAFYMGQYFSNDSKTGITKVINLATRSLAYQVEPPEWSNYDPLLMGSCSTILVESGGKILQLLRYREAELFHFDIYYLCFDKKENPHWEKISDIGDRMLFLDGCNGLSFCAGNSSGFKGNCIYFINHRHLYRYSIKDDSTEQLFCPFDSLQTWFVPSLV